MEISFIQLSIANGEDCHCEFQAHNIVVVMFVVVVGLTCHCGTTGVSVLSGQELVRVEASCRQRVCKGKFGAIPCLFVAVYAQLACVPVLTH